MKLHTISPAEGSVKEKKRLGRGIGLAQEKLPVRAIKVN